MPRLRSVLLSAAACSASSGLAWAAPFCAAGNEGPVLASHVAEQLGPLPVASLGPGGDALLRELVEQGCTEPSVRAALPNTCFGLASVSELGSRLVADLTSVPATALGARLRSVPPEQRVAVAFLAAVGRGGVEPSEVSHRVAHVLGYATEACVPPVTDAGDPVGVAVGVVWALTNGAPPVHDELAATARIADALAALRGSPPTALDHAFVDRLARQYAELRAAREAWGANAGNAVVLKRLLSAEYTSFQYALSLAHGRELTLPAEAWATLDAILAANLDGAVDQLRSWLVPRAELDAAIVDRAALLLRFARATSQEQAERIVRGQALGLGPWSEKILFSASAGVPRLESNDFNVVGEGMLGYNDDAWGLAGNGGISVLDFSSDEYVASTVKLFGGGDGWFSLPLGDRTRLDLRANLEVVLFDSDTTVVATGGILDGNETSLLVRGGGLLGVRHTSTRFAAGAWAGAGGQLESYDQRATVVTESGSPTQLDDVDTVSLLLRGRARMQWAFLPDTLALRLSADGEYYELARMSAAIDATGPQATLVETDEAAIQLELVGRLFVDVEAARVLGFVPGAGVGIDHYQLAVAGQDTLVTTIPVYMVGIRRATF